MAEKNQKKTEAEKPASASDDDEFNKLVAEEEAARKAALAAVEDVKTGIVEAVAPPPPPPVASGDVQVECLVDDNHCFLGNRRYILKKGFEMPMHPSHANELAQVGAVVIRN
jgi:hypothetical protein